MRAPRIFCRTLPALAACAFFCAAPWPLWCQAQPYATRIAVGANIEVSLYTPAMFRVRVSQLQGEKFPSKYEIPFVVGRVEPWKPVEFRHWDEDGVDLIETSALRIRISRKDSTWTVWAPGGKERIYPSNGPLDGMFRDGYAVF